MQSLVITYVIFLAVVRTVREKDVQMALKLRWQMITEQYWKNAFLWFPFEQIILQFPKSAFWNVANFSTNSLSLLFYSPRTTHFIKNPILGNQSWLSNIYLPIGL